MKFLKYTEHGKIEKYVNDIEVITFTTTRNAITMSRFRHGGRTEYIQRLLKNGYQRTARTKAGA